MNSRDQSRHRLVAAAVLLAAVALLVVSVMGFMETRRAMSAAAAAEAEAVARSVRQDLERAVGYGIPLEWVEGANDYLNQRAGRAAAVSFLAISGPDGRRLFAAGDDPAAIDRVLARTAALPIPAPVDGRDAHVEAVEAEGFLVLRLPLRLAATTGSAGGPTGGQLAANDAGTTVGAVIAGVDPAAVVAGLRREVGESVPFWLGCLLLVGIWAHTAAVAAVAEPMARLREACVQAAAGQFTVLLVRRSRDAVGRCLLAFNGVVAGLHARRQGFSLQADEVEHAVFDAEVAANVAETRRGVLAALGDGLSAAPRRLDDPRAGDRDVFAVSTIAAGVIGAIDAFAVAGDHGWTVAAVVAVLALAGVLAARWPWHRWVGIVLAAVLIAFSAYMDALASAAPVAAVFAFAGINAGAAGWAAGLAVEQRRVSRTVLPGGRQSSAPAAGWLVPVAGGGIAGAAMAWTLWGDPVTTGAGTALLGLVMLTAAAVSEPRGRKGG